MANEDTGLLRKRCNSADNVYKQNRTQPTGNVYRETPPPGQGERPQPKDNVYKENHPRYSTRRNTRSPRTTFNYKQKHPQPTDKVYKEKRHQPTDNTYKEKHPKPTDFQGEIPSAHGQYLRAAAQCRRPLQLDCITNSHDDNDDYAPSASPIASNGTF